MQYVDAVRLGASTQGPASQFAADTGLNVRQNLRINVRGFSLIEIMITVVTISILALVVAPF